MNWVRISQFETYLEHPIPQCPQKSSGFFSLDEENQSSEWLSGFPKRQRGEASSGPSPRGSSWWVLQRLLARLPLELPGLRSCFFNALRHW